MRTKKRDRSNRSKTAQMGKVFARKSGAWVKRRNRKTENYKQIHRTDWGE